MRPGSATRHPDQDPKGPRPRDKGERDPRADEFNELFERLASVFEAVGDPQRLRILVWVCANAGERFSPREVADGLGAALGTIAYHVRCLSLAGLIAPAAPHRNRRKNRGTRLTGDAAAGRPSAWPLRRSALIRRTVAEAVAGAARQQMPVP